jgi:hypothetical protein
MPLDYLARLRHTCVLCVQHIACNTSFSNWRWYPLCEASLSSSREHELLVGRKGIRIGVVVVVEVVYKVKTYFPIKG